MSGISKKNEVADNNKINLSDRTIERPANIFGVHYTEKVVEPVVVKRELKNQ